MSLSQLRYILVGNEKPLGERKTSAPIPENPSNQQIRPRSARLAGMCWGASLISPAPSGMSREWRKLTLEGNSGRESMRCRVQSLTGVYKAPWGRRRKSILSRQGAPCHTRKCEKKRRRRGEEGESCALDLGHLWPRSVQVALVSDTQL